MKPLHYRFGVVLALIVITLAFSLAASPDSDLARFVAVTLQASTLVAAAIASRAHRWVTRLCVGAAAIGIAGSGATLVGPSEFGEGAAVIVALPYVVLTPWRSHRDW